MGVVSAPTSIMPGRPSSLDIKNNEGPVDLQPPMPSARINVLDIKDQIVKRVGLDCANKYFMHFKSFVSSCISKQELDKLVVLTIGKENVALHNQLVKSILSNAVNAKVPPPLFLSYKSTSKLSKVVRAKPATPLDSNGDVLPLVLAAKLSNGDCFSGKKRVQSSEYDLKVNSNQKEQPVSDSCRPVQQSDGADTELDAEANCPCAPPLKRPRAIDHIATDNATPFNSKKLSIPEKGTPRQTQSYIRIPLDMPPSFGCARQLPCLAFPMQLLTEESMKWANVDAELCDVESTYRLMEEMALQEGLEGVDRNCADLLNHAVDHFLSKLIKSCIDVVKCRQFRLSSRSLLLNNELGDVVSPRNHNGDVTCISLRDFKVAMDLSPEQLGEDWPLQLERINGRLFDQEASST